MTSRPVILIVDSSVAMTGAFRAVSNAARALAEDADVILALPHASIIDPAEFAVFKQVVRLPIRTLRRSLRDLILFFPALLTSALALRRLLRFEATHLFVNDFFLPHGAVVRALGYRGFIGAWIRMDPAALPSWIAKIFLKAVWSSSDRIIAVSRHAKNAVPPAAQLRVIYDPVPYAPVAEPVMAQDEQSIVYVANYIRGKGQEHAIAAFSRIMDRHPAATLRFWGGDMGLEKNRAFRGELEALAERSGASARICFNGFTADPRQVLASARMALNFSESETLSLTCIEGGLAGVPVIATRCGGPEEVVIDGETGFLVERGDLNAMADRMSRLLDEPDLARRLGDAGASFAGLTFSPDVFRKAFLDAIEIRRS